MAFCSARPAGVMATIWPRPSSGQASRAASSASTSRSTRREVLYWGSSIAFSSSSGRSPCRIWCAKAPAARRTRRAAEIPPDFSSDSTAASSVRCARTRRAQAEIACWLGCLATIETVRYGCSCINREAARNLRPRAAGRIADRPIALGARRRGRDGSLAPSYDVARGAGALDCPAGPVQGRESCADFRLTERCVVSARLPRRDGVSSSKSRKTRTMRGGEDATSGVDATCRRLWTMRPSSLLTSPG